MGERNKIRKHIYVSGRVQGVGFRYRTYYIAQSLGITGWVKNLYDGRVEMEVQGTGEEINQLFKRLQQDRYIYIEDCEVRQLEVVRESSFEIRG